jgi:hypothetical protein
VSSDPRPPTAYDWDLYRALREQWTHEDNLINHRLMWLILSEGLLFTAYGSVASAKLHWLVIGFPFFGMTVAALIGLSIYAALAAIESVQRIYDEANLAGLLPISPGREQGSRGRLAAQALPFVFGGLWVLALMGAFHIPR